MVKERVEIIDETNFYEGMIGKVIQEQPKAVLVEIPFTTNDIHKVWFFNNQVEIINEMNHKENHGKVGEALYLKFTLKSFNKKFQ